MYKTHFVERALKPARVSTVRQRPDAERGDKDFLLATGYFMPATHKLAPNMAKCRIAGQNSGMRLHYNVRRKKNWGEDSKKKKSQPWVRLQPFHNLSMPCHTPPLPFYDPSMPSPHPFYNPPTPFYTPSKLLFSPLHCSPDPFEDAGHSNIHCLPCGSMQPSPSGGKGVAGCSAALCRDLFHN